MTRHRYRPLQVETLGGTRVSKTKAAGWGAVALSAFGAIIAARTGGVVDAETAQSLALGLIGLAQTFRRGNEGRAEGGQ